MLIMMDLQPMLDILNHITTIYEKNAKQTDRDFDLCKRYARHSKMIVIAVLIVYNTVLFFYQIPKFVEYLMTGVLDPPIGVYFPKAIGALFTNSINVAGAYSAGSVLIPIDLIIFLVFANITLNSTVIQREIKAWEVILKGAESNERQIKRKVFDIIQMHTTHNE